MNHRSQARDGSKLHTLILDGSYLGDAGAEEVVEATREATREATARRREDAREARESEGGHATVTVTCPKCGRGLGARRFAWHLERCLRANAA